MGAAVDFGCRPYIEETMGGIVVTLDATVGHATAAATIAGVPITGMAAYGRGSLVPFPLHPLPPAVDELATIAVATESGLVFIWFSTILECF